MIEKFDLHCHSSTSDGDLSPTELILRAREQGVTSLALTDHDSTAGLAEAQQAADSAGIHFIPGIELSANWNKQCFHIVGLNINPDSPSLQKGTRELQSIRIERAKKIALKLEKKKISGALTAVSEQVGKGMITRTHFAHFLLTQNHVSSMQQAFDRYLGKGKPAFVATQWTELEIVIKWIKEAGGVAVLAHPMRYKLTASFMKRLLTAFSDMGGQGIEVVSGRNNPDEIHRAANYAKQFNLAGSMGSDFHTPKNPWVELGRLAPLPSNVPPVWGLFA